MKQIKLMDLAKHHDAWKKLCPNLDINKPPEGLVYLSEDIVMSLFGEDKPAMVDMVASAPKIVPRPIAIPSENWPLWTKPLVSLRTPQDRGIGDIIARSVGPIGGDLYKSWHLKIFGKPCGCSERQETLNMLYPFNGTPVASIQP